MYANVAQVYDLVYAERRADVDFYLTVIAGTGRQVLEVGAGTGRVLLPAAGAHPSRSFTALDMDADELAVLDNAARALGLTNVITTHALVVDLPPVPRYDLVTAPFRVLQHCLSPEELLKALIAIAAAMVPGGVFAFDLFNPSIPMLSNTGLIVDQEFIDSNGATVQRRVYVNERSYFTQVQHIEEYYDVTHPDGSTQALEWLYPTRYYFLGEVLPLLKAAGLDVLAVHSDFVGTPFGDGDYPGDLVISARKAR